MQEFNIESVVNILLQLYSVGAHGLCMGLARVWLNPVGLGVAQVSQTDRRNH